jgi:hypothetical protein
MPNGTRDYIRGSGGKFAGANTKGTKVTTGRAGGFANASFRARVLSGRGQKKAPPTKGKRTPIARTTTRSAVKAGLRGAGRSVGRGAARGVTSGVLAGAIGGAYAHAGGVSLGSSAKFGAGVAGAIAVAHTARGIRQAPGAARASARASVRLGTANRAAAANVRAHKAAGLSTKGVRSQTMSVAMGGRGRVTTSRPKTQAGRKLRK